MYVCVGMLCVCVCRYVVCIGMLCVCVYRYVVCMCV